MNTKKLIQIHLLQNYAPANLNRDDTGSPKDALFGGVLRGRISSQCLKRSMRTSMFFEEAFKDAGLLAQRTKQLHKLLAEALMAEGATEKEREDIVARVPEFGKKSAKEVDSEKDTEGNGVAASVADAKLETKQLIYLAPNEVMPLAQKLLKAYREVGAGKWAKYEMKDLRRELGSSVPRSVDIALFGRMTTDEAFEDVHAAAQVAHALSTNALKQEFDYYTAVDDLSGQTGAGMIGDVEFNSSTYYKYLNVHFGKLIENLGGDDAAQDNATRAVMALLEAAIFAQPSGKQNSFAAHNLPDFVLVEVSSRILPVNYANAFLAPARAKDNKTVVEVAADQLVDHASKTSAMFGLKAERAYLSTSDTAAIDGWAVQPTLDDLKAWLNAQLEA